LPAGDSAHILTVDGSQRTYHLHVPASLGHRAALVVVLHGGKGTGLAAEQTMGWDAVADRVGAVVAYPDGVGRTWNAGGGCCGTSAATGIDDVTFISRLVHQLLGDTRISPDRVYATGGSNGGMLTYALACSTPIFAAIAPVAATQLGECRDPHPTSVLHIHGSADQLVRYDGRPVTPAPGYPIDGPPIPALMSRWRSIDECTAPTETHANGLRVSLASCVSGRVVELVVIDGGGHAWSKAFTPMIWDFFARHHR
jgi:polyhydroxybutyrate depolymerase